MERRWHPVKFAEEARDRLGLRADRGGGGTARSKGRGPFCSGKLMDMTSSESGENMQCLTVQWLELGDGWELWHVRVKSHRSVFCSVRSILRFSANMSLFNGGRYLTGNVCMAKSPFFKFVCQLPMVHQSLSSTSATQTHYLYFYVYLAKASESESPISRAPMLVQADQVFV